ncbi:unnamed protein product [Durusdinium trenchii]|uniref:Thioredoxin domain-containing protein n=1 Tax=Durusdinium trenchii TaxID=1381693 RepID=A0ABP0S4G7_9DINO
MALFFPLTHPEDRARSVADRQNVPRIPGHTDSDWWECRSAGPCFPTTWSVHPQAPPAMDALATLLRGGLSTLRGVKQTVKRSLLLSIYRLKEHVFGLYDSMVETLDCERRRQLQWRRESCRPSFRGQKDGMIDLARPPTARVTHSREERSIFLGKGAGPTIRSPVAQRLAQLPRRAVEDDQLPEAPPGGRVVHVEYCMFCKFLPEYLKFRKALAERFGERVLCFANHEDTLQELIRQPKSRINAFEVVDVKSKKVLYTKLGSGLLITERQEWLEKLFEEIEELCQEES